MDLRPLTRLIVVIGLGPHTGLDSLSSIDPTSGLDSYSDFVHTLLFDLTSGLDLSSGLVHILDSTSYRVRTTHWALIPQRDWTPYWARTSPRGYTLHRTNFKVAISLNSILKVFKQFMITYRCKICTRCLISHKSKHCIN